MTINVSDSEGKVVKTVTTNALTAATTLNDLVADLNTKLGNSATARVVIREGKASLEIVGKPLSNGITLTNGAGTPVNSLFGQAEVTSKYTHGDMGAKKVKPHNTLTVKVYDKLGTRHDIKLDVLAVSQNKWAFEMHSEDADRTIHPNGVFQKGFITFNNNGTIKDILDEKGQSRIPKGEGATDASINIKGITWTKTDAGDPGESDIKFDFGEINGNTGLTQNSSGKDKKGNFVYDTYFINQDGASTGDFTGVKIQDDGTVIAAFANGLQRPIYRIAIGTFEAPNELEAATGNVYRETEDSGSFLMRQAGEDGAGKVVPSALEASNVDLATEFTTMIVTQRTYSANSKVITTSDDMLDELLRIKR